MVKFHIINVSQRKDVLQFAEVYGELLKSPDDPDIIIKKILYKLHKEGIPDSLFNHSNNLDNINNKIELKFIIRMETTDCPTIKLKQFINDLNNIVKVTGCIGNIMYSS